MCYAIGSDQGYYPRRYKGLVPSRFNILMKRRAPYPDGQWLERQGNLPQKISGNFILGNFLLGNFDTPGKVVVPKIIPQIRLPQKLCTPRKDHRQDQEDRGELMVASLPPPNICLVRSCAPNICLCGAEELGERMFAWEGAAGRTFAWASGAARSAATNKKKKKI